MGFVNSGNVTVFDDEETFNITMGIKSSNEEEKEEDQQEEAKESKGEEAEGEDQEDHEEDAKEEVKEEDQEEEEFDELEFGMKKGIVDYEIYKSFWILQQSFGQSDQQLGGDAIINLVCLRL